MLFSKLFSRVAFAGALFGISSGQAVVADQSKTFGDYTVHYNAFTTDVLPPEVARGFGISRSRSRGMVNISVTKSETIGAPRSVPAKVSGTATNLTGQLRNLDVRQVKDGQAYYYIAELPVANEETLDFTLSVRPEGASKAYEVEFRQQFFTQ